MTTIRQRRLVGVLVGVALAAALCLPAGVRAAPPAQEAILFDLEFPVPAALDNATPQKTFSFTCVEGKVASVYVETTAGDLTVDAVVTGPSGSPLASGSLVSTNPAVTVIEAFTIPAAGPCLLTLSRVGATSGQADVHLLSGYAQLTKWDAFDGLNSPMRMNWEPYTSENMEVAVTPQGQLSITVVKDNLMGYALPEDLDATWADLYIQADFTIEGSPSYFEYGFVLRADDQVESFYSATFSSDGDYSVYYYDGEWTPVQDWTVSPAIDPTNKLPRMGVWVQGNIFRLYFNDQLVAEVTDTTGFATEGAIGLVAATGVDQFDPLTVYADNVLITTPFQGVSTTTTLPFGGEDATKPTPDSGGVTGLFGANNPPATKPPAATLPPIVPTQAPVIPTPKPTATPEEVQGLVLNNWASSQPSDVLGELQSYGLAPSGGAMQINVPTSFGDTTTGGFSFYPLGRGQTFRNFVLSFDAQLVYTGAGSGCGMYFRNTNSYSNSAMIFEDGSALLGEWDSDGNLGDASFFDFHDAVQPGQGSINRVLVVAMDESVLMYVNGVLVTVVEFTPQTGGTALELFVAQDDFGNTVRTYCQLDNIWLWGF